MPIQNARRKAAFIAILLSLSVTVRADDAEKTIRKAVERSTLNQPGTKPFHLKAVVAPTLERDRGSNRTGEVEIWWASPTQWKREVRSPQFHQIAIINGNQEWQKNEGDYFPEWLREVSIALIEPIPSLDNVLEQVKGGDGKTFMGQTNFSWEIMSTDGKVKKAMGAGINIDARTGLLQGGLGLGWCGFYSNYEKFHGRMIARKVQSGSPEVTANVTVLEDLGDIPSSFFSADESAGDSPLLRTIVLDEASLRKNLAPAEPVAWPPVKDGPLEGVLTTEIVVDRTGKVRDVGTIVSDNPGVNEAFASAIGSMQLKPFMQNGSAVQVVSRVTMPFKTVRPAGAEIFDSARNYFERGRRLSLPAAGNGKAYVLQATFQAKVHDGKVAEGRYVDTWKSDQEWRREATIQESRYVRSRKGEKAYLLSEGPDARLLQLVLRVIEPIPAIDTFVESDWRIKRDTVDGVKTIRVLSGYESPEGDLDPEQARGYWFDENGRLVKAYFEGMDVRMEEFKEVNGVPIAARIRLLYKGGVAMVIHIKGVSDAGTLQEDMFELRGHEWQRSFTSEVR